MVDDVEVRAKSDGGSKLLTGHCILDNPNAPMLRQATPTPQTPSSRLIPEGTIGYNAQ
jgi:hypothetical protein